MAEGIVLTLETIVSQYKNKPFLADRGVPEHDVFARVTDEEYKAFYEEVEEVATLVRKALDSSDIVFAVINGERYLGIISPPPKSLKF